MPGKKDFGCSLPCEGTSDIFAWDAFYSTSNVPGANIIG
jgi:hypothetical protein